MEKKTEMKILYEFIDQDNYLIINKTMMKVFGLKESVFLSDLISKYRYFENKNMCQEDGWFFNTERNREDDTQLSPKQQRKIITKFLKIKVIETKREGLPAKVYFRINIETLLNHLQMNKKINSSSSDSGEKKERVDEQKKQVYLGKNGTTYYNSINSNSSKEKSNNGIIIKKHNNNTTISTKQEIESSSFSNFHKDIKENKPTLSRKEENKSTLSRKEENKPTLSRKEENKPTLSEREEIKNMLIEQCNQLPYDKKERVTTPACPPQKVKETINLWNSYELVKHEKITTKTYQELVRTIKALLNGTYFSNTKNGIPQEFKNKKFTLEDFRLAFDRHHRAATDLNYENTNSSYKEKLKRTTLLTFIYNSRSQSNKHRSLFLYWLKNTPRLTNKDYNKVELIDGSAKGVYVNLKKYWKEYLDEYIEFTDKDENSFRKAANRVSKEYFGKLEEKAIAMLVGGINQEGVFARYMIESIEEIYYDDSIKVTPSWLCTDNMFNKRLKEYLGIDDEWLQYNARYVPPDTRQ